MNRIVTLILGATLLAAGLGTISPCPASAAPAASLTCLPGVPVTGDYNGDGSADLAVSVWDGGDPSPLFVSLDRTNVGTWLDVDGETLNSADLNGDVCADAIVTRWQFSITTVLGTPSGLEPTTARVITLPQSAGIAPPLDRVIARPIGFRHDGISQLVVAGFVWVDSDQTARNPFVDVFTLDASGTPGVPQVIDMSGQIKDVLGWRTNLAADDGVLVAGAADTVNGKKEAGAVYVFTPDATDHRILVHRAAITQASPGVAGTPEAWDNFGYSVALRDGYLAIGTPSETLGSAKRTGQVQLMRWDAGTSAFRPVRAIDQNTKGVVGTNEGGDHFGSVVAIARGLTAPSSYDVVIGTPYENVGKATDAGAFTVANFTTATYRTYTQNTRGVPGTAERNREEATRSGDLFGAAFGILPTSATVDTLAIGAPGETNGHCLTQGYVTLSDGRRLTGLTKWTYLKPPTTGCSTYDSDVFDGWGAGFGDSQWYES